MTLFGSAGWSMRHAAPSEDGNCQASLVVKEPQARRRSNPEVATKHLAQTEQTFFKHRDNCSHKIIHQGLFESGTVKQIRSLLVKASPPLLHCR
jgi:hypothetical protein